MKKIEATGKTVDAAVENALKKAGLTREEADVEIISEGGFLKQSKVAVSKKQTDGEKVKEFLENVLEKMHFDSYFVEMKETDDTIAIELVGDGSGKVIGYRGEVLDSLQYLSSLILNNSGDKFKRIVLDSEGYRAKREKTLIQLAKNLEQKVKRTGKAAKLEPMNPYERRIIHTALQDSKYVSTESDGVMNNRHVVISPKLSNDILNAPTVNRKSMNFVYRSDKKRRR
ncbi:MAG: protein jag [Corallococcus sp.]|nr:protein jag [Corallococcus sp.]